MRSKFSEAIHRSIKRQLHKYKETGKIGDQKPENMDAARELAAQNAYTRVKTQPGSGDIPPRTK